MGIDIVNWRPGCIVERDYLQQEARDNTACIRTVAALAEKAVDLENGERYLTTVQPRDLPECWGVRFHKTSIPGCHMDFDAIKKELELNGFPQRKGYFALPGGKKQQQRCTLVPKHWLCVVSVMFTHVHVRVSLSSVIQCYM